MKRYVPLCLLLLGFSAQGALNKWVDSQGNVHYSDEPPPENVKAGTLTVPPADSSVPPQKTFLEREEERQKAQKAKEEADQKASGQPDGEQARRAACDTLRANLSVLKDGSAGVVTTNDKGEQVVMDGAERQRRLAETQKQIAANCEGQ